MRVASSDTRLAQRINELKAITGASMSTGWLHDETAFLLYALVRWYRPDITVHIGHLWGKSALCVLEGLEADPRLECEPQNSDKGFSAFVRGNTPLRAPDAVVYSIDPKPKNVPDIDAGLDYLTGHYPGMFQFARMRSDDWFTMHRDALADQLRGKRLLGIVDGDHSVEAATRDLEHLSDLSTAQLLVVDDTSWLPALRVVVTEFAPRRGYQSLVMPHYAGLALLYREAK